MPKYDLDTADGVIQFGERVAPLIAESFSDIVALADTDKYPIDDCILLGMAKLTQLLGEEFGITTGTSDDMPPEEEAALAGYQVLLFEKLKEEGR